MAQGAIPKRKPGSSFSPPLNVSRKASDCTQPDLGSKPHDSPPAHALSPVKSQVDHSSSSKKQDSIDADEKKGAVKFKKPLFSVVSNTLSDEAAARADHYDNVLQDYLDGYLGVTSKEPDTEDAGNSGADDFAPEPTPEPELVEAPF